MMRAQFEHAIAVLIGKPPASFHPAAGAARPAAASDSAGMPSELLQRRPDIAAAERRIAEANEQIGIAEAAYLSLTEPERASGFEGTNAANWFGWPSLFWAVGTSLTQPLFDGGRIRANRNRRGPHMTGRRGLPADHAERVPGGGGQPLRAADPGSRRRSSSATAVVSADKALRIFTNRYVGGEDAYLQVITAQTIRATQPAQ